LILRLLIGEMNPESFPEEPGGRAEEAREHGGAAEEAQEHGEMAEGEPGAGTPEAVQAVWVLWG
jgi:hypothetical protein